MSEFQNVAKTNFCEAVVLNLKAAFNKNYKKICS